MLARISPGVHRNVAENQTLMSSLFIKDQYVPNTKYLCIDFGPVYK